jgi:uncharacterized protein
MGNEAGNVTERVTAIAVTIVAASPGVAHTMALSLPQGSTAADALKTAMDRAFLSLTSENSNEVGVFGKRVGASYVLSDGDRIELYRPLTVDPKIARQMRVEKKRRDKDAAAKKQKAG